jgi:hypothetical protein
MQKITKRGGQKQVELTRKIVLPSQITKLFNKQLYNKVNPTQKVILKYLVIYVAKNYDLLSFIENLLLKQLILQQCGH